MMITKSLSYLYFFLFTLFYSFTSCSDDEGFSDPRDAFIGTYAMTQTCNNNSNPDYSVIISKADQHEDQIFIQNLGAYGAVINASVDGNNIEIPAQEVGAGLIGNVTLSGDGTLDATGTSLLIELEVLVPGPNNTTNTSQCEINGEKTD